MNVDRMRRVILRAKAVQERDLFDGLQRGTIDVLVFEGAKPLTVPVFEPEPPPLVTNPWAHEDIPRGV